MTDTPRLIEQAFPLEQASLDSVHEKNVRHRHIPTLPIWPDRRSLAARWAPCPYASFAEGHVDVEHGARAILMLARPYGTAILHNSLALANAMGIEDGDSGL